MASSPFTEPERLAHTRQILEAIISTLSSALSCDARAIELAVMTVAAGGHLLLEDVPGIGKTTLARALAATISGKVSRIQFTADMLPSDITGVTVFDQETHAFTFHPGPVFAQVVLADEINRANPKAQAALLEAMEERRVTVDGTTYRLPSPFTVIATQNPVEMEGTFPLPEAQLDRFMTRTSLGYPTPAAEARMLAAPTGYDPVRRIQPVCAATDMVAVIQTVAHLHVSPQVAAYAVALLAATRSNPAIALGASPRAGIALLAMGRARALLHGQDAVFPGDVRAMAASTLAHRLILNDPALDGDAAAQLDALAAALRSVPAPRGA